jgi:hypothetical protein
MDSQNAIDSPARSERKFAEVIGIWPKIFQMNDDFFQKEISFTSVQNTLFSIITISLLSGFGTLLASILGMVIRSIFKTGAGSVNGNPSTQLISTLLLICFSFFSVPIGFYMNIGIMQISAMCFGGKGSFSSQAYLTSLFYAPLSIISAIGGLLTAIPIVGLIILLIVSIFIIVANITLVIRVIKINHSLSIRKAIGAFFAPIIILLVPLSCCFGSLLLGGLSRVH